MLINLIAQSIVCFNWSGVHSTWDWKGVKKVTDGKSCTWRKHRCCVCGGGGSNESNTFFAGNGGCTGAQLYWCFGSWHREEEIPFWWGETEIRSKETNKEKKEGKNATDQPHWSHHTTDWEPRSRKRRFHWAASRRKIKIPWKCIPMFVYIYISIYRLYLFFQTKYHFLSLCVHEGRGRSKHTQGQHCQQHFGGGGKR